MDKFIVMKFGGSSQCLQGMTVILQKLNEHLKVNHRIVFVISAVGKTTNNLYGIVNFVDGSYEKIYDAHKQLCNEINVDFSQIDQYLQCLYTDMITYKYEPFGGTQQLKLKIVSWGEILASKIVHLFLQSKGITCEYLNAHMFMRNKSNSNDIDGDTLNLKGEFYCDKQVLHSLISKHKVCITQGFIAKTHDDKYCVLTRSGSNTSASLIANALDAERLEIFTDVCGIYSGDPRKIENTQIIPFARYDVCLEASSMGTQLIHPFSIKPCSDKNIPIFIRNTFEPDKTGTVINTTGHSNEKVVCGCGSNSVHLISIQDTATIFQIYSLDMSEGYGFMADIFGVFKDEKIDVGIVTTSQFEITTTTSEKCNAKIERAKLKLQEKYRVDVIYGCSIVSIIAEDVLHNKKIDRAKKMVLKHSNEIGPIYISVPSSNKLTWSYVVNSENASALANMLHEYLLSEITTNKITKKRKISEANAVAELVMY